MSSPGSFPHSRDFTLQGFQPELELKPAEYTSVLQTARRTGGAYPTETKLAHDAPSTARLRTPVFNSSGASVLPESVELELGLVADLRREGLVASYVEVGSASDLVGGHTLAGLDVAKNSNLCHNPFPRLLCMVERGGAFEVRD